MKQPLVAFLKNELDRLKERNPSYSLRAFAKRLKVNPSTLSEVLNGRRLPTSRFGQTVSQSLDLSEVEKQQLVGGLFKKNTLSRQRHSPEDSRYLQLEHDQYSVIEQWHYVAILSLAETSGFRSNPEWIAKRLGLKKKCIAEALSRLVRLRLLEQKNGHYVPTGRALATTSGVANPLIRRAHLRNIVMIEASLERTPLEDQDFSMITVATNKANLEEAKTRIKVFRRELAAFLETGPKDEVYNISMYLFPLTKNNKGVST